MILPSAQLEMADPRYAEKITLVEADVLDPELPSHVEDLIPASVRCLVIEDSAHVYDTTWAAFAGFAGFVPEGDFFVVEDGCVDVEEMRPDESWPRGVLPALRDWLRDAGGRRVHGSPRPRALRHLLSSRGFSPATAEGRRVASAQRLTDLRDRGGCAATDPRLG